MTCLYCNTSITGKYTKKFCSISCSAKFNNSNRKRTKWTDRQREQFSQAKKSAVSQGIAKLPTPPKAKHIKEKTCTNCGVSFNSVRGSFNIKGFPTYCSEQCFLEIKQRNARGTKGIKYNELIFDSNWEVDLAKYLDQHNISWIRPLKSIVWFDKACKPHKYFPDFYLPDYNVYLDPKNPIVISKQQEKLEIVSKMITLVYGDLTNIKNYVEQLTGLEPACIH